MADSDTTRVERDTMGEMLVPAGAYFGASTQRAVSSISWARARPSTAPPGPSAARMRGVAHMADRNRERIDWALQAMRRSIAK